MDSNVANNKTEDKNKNEANTNDVVINKTKPSEKMYNDSREYWSHVEPTVNGMLGGYENVSKMDIKESNEFLMDLFTVNINEKKNRNMSNELALDCGAGIGRITKKLLLKNFKKVEMVDVTDNFINEAKNYLGDEAKRVAKFYISGLESFEPEENKYDCIWMQWVLGYLNDDHLVSFFERCKKALKPNGLCVLKENIERKETDFDEKDGSYTRTRQSYIDLIHKANMCVIAEERQRKFPRELYEVRMIAFK